MVAMTGDSGARLLLASDDEDSEGEFPLKGEEDDSPKKGRGIARTSSFGKLFAKRRGGADTGKVKRSYLNREKRTDMVETKERKTNVLHSLGKFLSDDEDDDIDNFLKPRKAQSRKGKKKDVLEGKDSDQTAGWATLDDDDFDDVDSDTLPTEGTSSKSLDQDFPLAPPLPPESDFGASDAPLQTYRKVMQFEPSMAVSESADRDEEYTPPLPPTSTHSLSSEDEEDKSRSFARRGKKADVLGSSSEHTKKKKKKKSSDDKSELSDSKHRRHRKEKSSSEKSSSEKPSSHRRSKDPLTSSSHSRGPRRRQTSTGDLGSHFEKESKKDRHSSGSRSVAAPSTRHVSRSASAGDRSRAKQVSSRRVGGQQRRPSISSVQSEAAPGRRLSMNSTTTIEW